MDENCMRIISEVIIGRGAHGEPIQGLLHGDNQVLLGRVKTKNMNPNNLAIQPEWK